MHWFLVVKPHTISGYSDRYTTDCERVLVRLLRGLGPWKESMFLIGGLTPRYLVADRPHGVPAHAGTMDVDIVIDVQILSDTAGYRSLERNLREMNFVRSIGNTGQRLSWRWQTHTESGALMVVEFLTDAPEIAGGRVEPLPTTGNISALNIPHSSIVFDLYQVAEIRAELLGGAGIATESVKHANLVSFTCLKAFAFDQRFERKDAYDLVYCIEHAQGSHESMVNSFQEALHGVHGSTVRNCLSILANRFAGESEIEGYLKDGPVAVARFEFGDEDDSRQRELRLLKQRQVSSLIEKFLADMDL